MAQKQDVKTLIDAPVHILYCGVTMSGKTTLARHHAAKLVRSDYDVIIYDPVGTETINGTWPEKCIVFTDAEKFLNYLVKIKPDNDGRPTFVFVDESADIFGHDNKDAHWIPRRVRHQGVYLRLISQRPKMLPPNVRTQCGHTYMFRLANDDAKMVCADAGHSTDIAQTPLDKGDFILLISGTAQIETGNVFDLCD